MALPCDICGKSGHAWFDCPKRATKPTGWKPDRLKKPKKVKASRVPLATPVTSPGGVEVVVHGEAPLSAKGVEAVDAAVAQMKKRGRPLSPNPKSPRAAYQRELMRKRREKSE